MNAYHILVSVVNIICGTAFVIGSNFDAGWLAGIAIIVGYFANLIAVFTCLFLIVLLIIRTPSGASKKLLLSQWLGFLNGLSVVGVWSIVSWSGYL